MKAFFSQWVILFGITISALCFSGALPRPHPSTRMKKFPTLPWNTPAKWEKSVPIGGGGATLRLKVLPRSLSALPSPLISFITPSKKCSPRSQPGWRQCQRFIPAPPGKLMMPRFNRRSHTVTPKWAHRLEAQHRSSFQSPISLIHGFFQEEKRDVSSTSRLCKRPHFPTRIPQGWPAPPRRPADCREMCSCATSPGACCQAAITSEQLHACRERQTTRQALPRQIRSASPPNGPPQTIFPVRQNPV